MDVMGEMEEVRMGSAGPFQMAQMVVNFFLVGCCFTAAFWNPSKGSDLQEESGRTSTA